MWSDILTNPLQGSKFKEMWSCLINCLIDYHALPDTNYTPHHTNNIEENKNFPQARLPLWGCIETNENPKRTPDQHVARDR